MAAGASMLLTAIELLMNSKHSILTQLRPIGTVKRVAPVPANPQTEQEPDILMKGSETDVGGITDAIHDCIAAVGLGNVAQGGIAEKQCAREVAELATDCTVLEHISPTKEVQGPTAASSSDDEAR
eukprot:GHRR01031987.1.p1 GENE.GHRR01031987.1~~GHRR01031987.1.p1  ORF type:complete len:126 (+),score=30.48 GHRR01031987.1:1128-1505(+)